MTLNKEILLLICFFTCLCSCERYHKTSGEIIVLENLLVEKTTEIQRLRNKAKQENTCFKGKLIHMVFFNLKSNLKENEINQFVAVIENLKEINAIESLIYGDFLEVGDTRSMRDMELVMQIVFEDMNGLKSYQTDPIHLKAKKSLSPFLEGAPLTYDYTVPE